MAFGNRPEKERKQQAQEKIIEIDVQTQGTLTFCDAVYLKINAKFAGTLDTRGTLAIGPAALVEANISGDIIVVAGKVKGNVIAKKMLTLMPTAVVTGDISTPKLNIVEGAIFQGKCQMLEEYLTVDELAQYLEIDEPAIVELATSGKIPAINDGGHWKFERVKIDSWASSGKIK
jgi:excisionase family DNA binding protein